MQPPPTNLEQRVDGEFAGDARTTRTKEHPMSQQDVRYYVTDDRLWYGRNGRLTPRKAEAEVMNARDARRVLSDMGINWFIKSGDLQDAPRR